MNAGKLRGKVEVWQMVIFKNELNEDDYKPVMVKDFWAEIVPQTGNLQRQQGIETILSRVTHKINARYMAARDVTDSMWFQYRGHRFDIRFILNPYFRNETLEFFCEEVIG